MERILDHRGKVGPEHDLRAVRGPARVISEIRDLPVHSFAAQRWYNEQAAVAVFGTVRNELTVGRPVRLPVVTWSLGDPHGIAATDLLHPDVEFATTIRTVGDEAPVGRP